MLLLSGVGTGSSFTTTCNQNSKLSRKADYVIPPLYVSIGLGPEETKNEEDENKELVAGVDYEIPDHESFRTSRRSPIDEQCDKWFEEILGAPDQIGVLGTVAKETRKILLDPVPLVNEVCHLEHLSFCSKDMIIVDFPVVVDVRL